MTEAQILTIILTALSVVGVPIIVALWRLTRKWAQLEDKLDTVIDKENEAKREVATRFADVERELQWLRDKVWQLYTRWGRRQEKLVHSGKVTYGA